MKIVRAEQDFIGIEKCIDDMIHRSEELPRNVFKEKFTHFLFIQFDDLFSGEFYSCLKQYLLDIGEGENVFWISPLIPDPKSYYSVRYNYYGSFEFTLSDSEEDVLTALTQYPEECDGDALTYVSDSLLVSSYSYRWAIYGEREREIAVCAFSSLEEMEKFGYAFKDLGIRNVEEATEYLMELFGRLPYYKSDKKRMDALKKFCNELRQNYRSSH